MNCILGMFALENMIGSVATRFVVQALKAAILEITDRSGEVFSPLLASNEAPHQVSAGLCVGGLQSSRESP
jgi:hypothetical protein